MKCNNKKIWSILRLTCVILFLCGLLIPSASHAVAGGDIILPSPVVTGNSVEICLNSRQSVSEVTDLVTPANNQQLSNILWAVSKAPMLGPTRDIYVFTRDGKYLYNPGNNTLSYISDEITDKGAFKIDWSVGSDGLLFDAGLIYMPTEVASSSLWTTSDSLVSSPKVYDIVFGSQLGMELQTEVVAVSSVPEGEPGWLPTPSTTGSNQLENVLDNLNYISDFSDTDLTLEQTSQLLWAGYGCTPHEPGGICKGLTVPSAIAKYYLTGSIYLINEDGVFRYHNRLPEDNYTMTTRDHRLEEITSDDVRSSLQAAVSELPEAPTYILISFDDARLQEIGDGYGQELISNFATLETGFVSFNYLLQASAMGLGANFNVEFTTEEQNSIQTVTGTPAGHSPQVIVSLGAPNEANTVEMSMVLEGGARPDAGWVVPVTAKIFTPGADVMVDTPVAEFNLTTAKSGGRAVCQCELPSGTYDVTIVSEHTLTNVRRDVIISSSSTSIDMGTLIEADANNDGIINISDFGILAVAFGKVEGESGYDYRADFDRSGIINISDFGLLAVNYAKLSPIEVTD